MTAWASLAGSSAAQTPAAEPLTVKPTIPEPDMGQLPATPGFERAGLRFAAPSRAARLARPLPLRSAAQPPIPSSDTPPVPKPTPSAGAATASPGPDPVTTDPPRMPSFDSAPSGRIWTRVEWLVWAASGQHVPAAITTSPPGTPANFAGIIPNPTTTVLWPQDRANNEFRSGFRLSAGFWIDPSQTMGVEGDFFFLNGSKKGLTVASDAGGNQILARPFFNALTLSESAILAAFPNQSRGALDVRAENWAIGGGVNALFNVSSSPSSRLDFLVGYRYLGVFDEVAFQQDSTVLAPGATFGNRTQVLDLFNTENNFNGGVLGLSAERKSGFWFVGGRASIAFGGVQQIARIDGRTVLTPASGLVNATYQGLYAQATNVGEHEETSFAVVPEFGVRLGAQLTESARLYVGYNWIYLSKVARAGDQVDTRVNTNFLPPGVPPVAGSQVPAFSGFKTTDYWMQGISFGLEITF